MIEEGAIEAHFFSAKASLCNTSETCPQHKLALDFLCEDCFCQRCCYKCFSSKGMHTGHNILTFEDSLFHEINQTMNHATPEQRADHICSFIARQVAEYRENFSRSVSQTSTLDASAADDYWQTPQQNHQSQSSSKSERFMQILRKQIASLSASSISNPKLIPDCGGPFDLATPLSVQSNSTMPSPIRDDIWLPMSTLSISLEQKSVNNPREEQEQQLMYSTEPIEFTRDLLSTINETFKDNNKYMQIIVMLLNGTSMPLLFNGNLSVIEVKILLFEKTGIPPSEQRLFFNTKELQNNMPMLSYNIPRDASIKQFIRPANQYQQLAQNQYLPRSIFSSQIRTNQ